MKPAQKRLFELIRRAETEGDPQKQWGAVVEARRLLAQLPELEQRQVEGEVFAADYFVVSA